MEPFAGKAALISPAVTNGYQDGGCFLSPIARPLTLDEESAPMGLLWCAVVKYVAAGEA
jgi:hypothetical protein